MKDYPIVQVPLNARCYVFIHTTTFIYSNGTTEHSEREIRLFEDYHVAEKAYWNVLKKRPREFTKNNLRIRTRALLFGEGVYESVSGLHSED